ncbi:MAG: hypothetical protein RL022_2291, partial [Chloroflexota bacterium]
LQTRVNYKHVMMIQSDYSREYSFQQYMVRCIIFKFFSIVGLRPALLR